MITAEEYRKQNASLMKEYEERVREWLNDGDDNQVVATFFKDGIVDPDVWFQDDFRPLFILKEVHDKKPQNRCVDFVAMRNGKDYDVWERRGMWRAFGALAKGIINSINDREIRTYEELYQEDLNDYHETLRKVAIINIKKVSGGNRGNSDISKRTKHYTCHACKFNSDLKKQVELINPSIIICCGTDIKSCLEFKDNKLFGFPVVLGLHPATNPNCRREAFYNETIENVCRAFLK